MSLPSEVKPAVRRGWSAERVARLAAVDLLQLRDNAGRLGDAAVVALCDAALQARPPEVAPRHARLAPPKHVRHLVSRSRAFQARGVYLPEGGGGWSGVRKSDGTVVMSLWTPAMVTAHGRCSQLLWAPDAGGSRPWSDTAAGRERLAHCKLALERGGAEGVLVYGEAGEPGEHNALSVYGADPERVVRFTVEQRGAEYWALLI